MIAHNKDLYENYALLSKLARTSTDYSAITLQRPMLLDKNMRQILLGCLNASRKVKYDD